MTAGLRVMNAGGVITQIDERFFTFALTASGSQATVTPTTQGGTSKLVIPISGTTFPLICIQPTAGFAALLFGSEFITTMPVGTNVPYWVYDKVPAALTGHNGLAIFNSAGDVVFYSGQKQARPVTAMVAGRSYAVAFAASNGRRVWEQGTHPGSVTDWWEDQYATGAKISGTSLLTNETQVAWAGPFGARGGSDITGISTIMLLDVTNH